MADDKKDLDKFINKVDEIESIIRNLSSGEDGASKEAMQKADQYLSDHTYSQTQATKDKKKYPAHDNTGVNRSVINQKAFQDDPPPPGSSGLDQPTMDQNAFLSIMEKDCQERAARKQAGRAAATVLKDQGNEQFKTGHYTEAIELYTEAMTHIKDMTALYTNRAQAYIKLDQYQQAIEDCDWALRVSEQCLKAYIHKGRAYLGLKEYDNSIDCYRKALEVEPNKEAIIKEYIQEVELARDSEQQEAEAKAVFDAGEVEAKGLVEILEKLNKSDQPPMYYSGGLRIIKGLLKDTNERTLFRTHGGLMITKDHATISKYFTACPRTLRHDQLDACASTIETFHAACLSNDENQRQLLEVVDLPHQLLRFLEVKLKHSKYIRETIIGLLHLVSQTQLGRAKIVANFDLPRLCGRLLLIMKVKGAIAVNAVGFFNNLALDKKFKVHLRENIEDSLLPAFEGLMLEGASNPAVLPACISTMANLCADTVIRRQVMVRKEMWYACCTTMETHTSTYSSELSQEILYSTMGLLMNMTFEKGDVNVCEYAVQLCKSCCDLLKLSGDSKHELSGGDSKPKLSAGDSKLKLSAGDSKPKLSAGDSKLKLSTDDTTQDLIERTVGVLSHILPLSTDAVDVCATEKQTLHRLLELLKADTRFAKPVIKCLTACTQHSTQAREDIVSSKSLKAVMVLLQSPDEAVVGNTALCLSHCSQVTKVPAALVKTDIIKELLTLARDGSNNVVQHNCAILIAKLAQADTRHLERLRELDGLGILHTVLKHVKE